MTDQAGFELLLPLYSLATFAVSGFKRELKHLQLWKYPMLIWKTSDWRERSPQADLHRTKIIFRNLRERRALAVLLR